MDDYTEVPIDRKVFDKFMRLTKQKLAENLCVMILQENVAKNKATEMQTKLDKAEAYVEQARAMIEAVMDRWYEYDT